MFYQADRANIFFSNSNQAQYMCPSTQLPVTQITYIMSDKGKYCYKVLLGASHPRASNFINISDMMYDVRKLYIIYSDQCKLQDELWACMCMRVYVAVVRSQS